jgi:hypothetical protein
MEQERHLPDHHRQILTEQSELTEHSTSTHRTDWSGLRRSPRVGSLMRGYPAPRLGLWRGPNSGGWPRGVPGSQNCGATRPPRHLARATTWGSGLAAGMPRCSSWMSLEVAEACGWTQLELFAIHRTAGVARADYAGALAGNATGRTVLAVTPLRRSPSRTGSSTGAGRPRPTPFRSGPTACPGDPDNDRSSRYTWQPALERLGRILDRQAQVNRSGSPIDTQIHSRFARLIPTCTEPHALAQSRRPMDMTRTGSKTPE